MHQLLVLQYKDIDIEKQHGYGDMDIHLTLTHEHKIRSQIIFYSVH